MAQVTVTINGRPYTVGCDDGQERQVKDLGAEVDRRARMLAEATGAVNEGLVLVLTNLMIADELFEAKQAQAAAEAEKDSLEAQLADAREALEAARTRLEQRRDQQAAARQAEEDLAVAMETLAARIETVAERLSNS